MQRAQARRAGQSRTHGAIRARQWDFPIPRLPAARAHSRCNSGDLGVHPGVWAVQRMRSDLSGPGKQPPLSSLGYTVSCFSPPARPPGGSPSKPVVGGGGTLCLITASTSPPAAVRDIATSFSFKRGFSSLDWIYRLAVPQERVSFPDLSSWAPRPRRAYRARICSALRWTPVARTLRHSITGLVMLVVVLLRSDEATCELAARRLGRRLD